MWRALRGVNTRGLLVLTLEHIGRGENRIDYLRYSMPEKLALLEEEKDAKGIRIVRSVFVARPATLQ